LLALQPLRSNLFVMPRKEAFTRERLDGIGAHAVEAALRTLSDQEAASAHFSCEYLQSYTLIHNKTQ